MTTSIRSRKELLAEIENLRIRLEEAEETLRAIGSGEVDAFVVPGPDGAQVFALEGADQPYRALVETMNEGVVTLASDGTILYCNKRLAAMLQVPLESLIGTPFGSYVAPADHPLFMARQEECTTEHSTDEIALICGSGDSVPVLISCCAIDLSGRRGVSIVVTELTQQKRNEEIMAAERLALSIIEQAGEAIVVCDEEGRIIRASRLTNQLCGESPLLKLFNELFQLRIVETECLFSVLTPLHGGCFESAEVEFKRSDNQLFHLLLNATPLKSAQNQIIGCVVTLTDISERRQAEEELQRLNEVLENAIAERTKELENTIENLKIETSERLLAMVALREKEQMLIQQSRQAAMGEMIGNIAHQWRQPLNTLGLTIQQLLLFYDLGDFNRDYLAKGVGSSMELIQHMSRTIDDFRNYFRPDKEKVEFNVREAIANSSSLVEDSFKNQQIKIEVIAKHDPDVNGYPNEFAQALLNILINARDALTERIINDPKVTITICTEGDRAVVTVADNAGGIPEEIMDKIFDPYFTTKGPQAGTGVGLFMSKTIIEKNMGGRLSVRNINRGAEFRIEV